MASVRGLGAELHIYGGWRLKLHRIHFLLRSLKYITQPRKYPLFRILPFRTGVLGTFAIARDLGLTKIVRYGDVYFSAPAVPHYPSTAFDHMVARGGLNVRAAGTARKQQIDTAILAITRLCHLDCRHCYEKANLGAPEEIAIGRWKDVVHDLQELGISVIVFSGGEPMLRFEGLLELAASVDKSRSDVHVHTAGQGVTLNRAIQLRKAGVIAMAVGLDDVDPQRHDDLRACPGAHRVAIEAVKHLRSAGILPYLNLCPTPSLVRSGDLWRYLDLARSLGVGFIQVLEPRPCGGYLDQGDHVLLTDRDRSELKRFYMEGNTSPRYRGHPAIRYLAHVEGPERLGCRMAGLSHFHIDSRGNVNPCVFLPVSFGNIKDEDFPVIYRRMREAVPLPLRTTCPALLLSPVLKERWVRGNGMPVAHKDIEEDWQLILSGRTADRPSVRRQGP